MKKFTPPKCPECNAWADVLETRTNKDESITRRVECANGHRYTVKAKWVIEVTKGRGK